MPRSRAKSARTDSPPKDCQSWRWVGVVFLVGLLNAGLFALATPLWQAPDEPGHFEYACLLGQMGRPLLGQERSLPLQQAILASLERHDFWRRVREPQPDPLPASFAADPFLLRSASQIGDEPPAYYLAPAALCRLPLAIEAQVRLMRLWGALLFGLTAAAAAWGWRGDARAAPGCAVVRLHPLTLGLLPMPAFIAGSINNDSLALLTATLLFAATLRVQRLGWSWRRGLGLAGLLALALASKKTNAFLLPWLALLAGAALWRGLGRRGWSRQRRLGLGGLAAAVVALALLLPTPTPAGWRGVGQLPGGGRISADLPGGPGWAARVQPNASREGRLYQDVAGAAALAGQPVEATLWVRRASDAPAAGRLLLRDTAGASQIDFEAGAQWQPVTLQRTLAITTTYARMALFADAGQPAAPLGDLLLAGAELRSLAAGPAGPSLLRNGDFSARARLAELLAAPLLARWAAFIPQSPAAAEEFPRSLLYGALTFAGFWGNYGWLQAPLPVALYGLLALISVAASAGLLARWRQEAALRPILAAWLLACALIAAQTFVPMLGRDWQPQGRYLFPALLPISGLLLLGLDHWLRLEARPAARAGLVAALLVFLALGLGLSARVW